MSIPRPTNWWNATAATDPLPAQIGTSLEMVGTVETEAGTGPNSQDVIHFSSLAGTYQHDFGSLVLFDPVAGTGSVSLFANADSFTGASPQVLTQAEEDGSESYWAIVFDSNRLQAIHWDAGTAFSATYSGTFAINTWYHLVVVWRAGVVDAWIDGVQVMTGVTPGSILPLPVDGADLAWDGTLANIGTWSEALNQSDATELYNGGLGLQYEELDIEQTLSENEFGVTHRSYKLPEISTLYNGWRARVGLIHQTGYVTVTTSGGDIFVGNNHRPDELDTVDYVTRPFEVTAYEADTHRNQWVTVPGGVAKYIEIWQATPQLPMNGIINWTFVPIEVGDTSRIVTHNAGVMTPTIPGTRYNLSLQTKIAHNIAANNSDTSFLIDGTFTGAGFDITPDIEDAFTSPRAGTFNRTFATFGMIFAAEGDTFSYSASYLGQGASDVDLTEMFLIIEV